MTHLETRQVIDSYDASVNRGDWDTRLTLFDEDVVIDEQLAGHVAGAAILRSAVGVMKRGYAKFQNVPKHVVVDGNISYMANFHDTVPFRPFVNQQLD